MMLRNRQEGVVLLTTLVVVVVSSMILMGTYSTVGSDIQMVDNRLAKWQAENLALQVSENILGDIANFDTPTAQQFTQDGYNVAVSIASCIRSIPQGDSSALYDIVPDYNFWQYDVDVDDPITGARATVHQGVRIKMKSGRCP